MPAKKPLYVFMDESGNFDFSSKGSDYFVLSAVYTEDPCTSAAALQALKYDLLAARSPDLEFHATNNTPGTRRRVSDVIADLGSTIAVHTLFVDKHLAHPKVQSEVAILAVLGKAMGRWLAKAAIQDHHDQLILVFDSVLTGKKQDAFKSELKPALKALGIPYHLTFHPVKSDLNGQIADYYSWAWFRRIEHKDDSWLGPFLAPTAPRWDHFDVFGNGSTRYW